MSSSRSKKQQQQQQGSGTSSSLTRHKDRHAVHETLVKVKSHNILHVHAYGSIHLINCYVYIYIYISI